MLLNDFVNAGIACGVLSESQVQEHLPKADGSQDGARIASVLVSAGKLTPYQAEMLLRGSGPNLVLGNYVLLDRLGQGGMGDVFKARHRRMDRIVALKTISPHFLRVPDALDRFYREAKAAALLTHPNIVTAHDADEAGGVHFLVMEYVAGSDLDALVSVKGPLAPDQALRVVLDAARGLEYAHSKGVVHRDIKPANVMFTLEGTVKILDMGLARIDQGDGERFTQSHCGFGSIDYMPPEQAENARVADQRSDIYSLGCTLYKLLTGKVIYESTSALKTLNGHREAPIPPLAIEHPQLERLTELYRRMVAKLPEDRPQSMTEVLGELTALAVDCDLSPLVTTVRSMHDRPSWLVDPEAKTIRPGEPMTPYADGKLAVLKFDGTKQTAGTKGNKTVPAPRAAAPPAPATPSNLAWKSRPEAGGLSQGAPGKAAARPSEAMQQTVKSAPEASVTLEEGEDWLEDVVSQSRTVEPRRKKEQKLDPLLIGGGAGLCGFVLLLGLLWIFTRGDGTEKQVAKSDATPVQATPVTPSPSPTTLTPVVRPAPPVIGPPVVGGDPPKLPFEPPIPLPPTKGEVPPFLPEKAPPETQPEKTPDKTLPEKVLPAPNEVVDLLKAINPKQDGIGKLWEKQTGGLVSRPLVAPHMRPPAESVFGLQLPVTVTANYQLRITVEHLKGEHGPMFVGLPHGNQWRLIVLDEAPPAGGPGGPGPGGPGGPGGFGPGGPGGFGPKGKLPPKGGFPQGGGGRDGLPPPLREPDVFLRSGKPTAVTFKVRDNGQTILCNDQPMAAAGPDVRPLQEMFELVTRKTVVILALGNYKITSLEWEAGSAD